MCAVDFMAFTRGSMDDYDRWAKVTDDQGWSWNSLFPYMLKVSLQVHHFYLHNSQYMFRWKGLLHLLTIGIQQANSIPKCMDILVPPPYSMTFKKRELTCDRTCGHKFTCSHNWDGSSSITGYSATLVRVSL